MMKTFRGISILIAVILSACVASKAVAQDAPARKIELARPGTLQEYVDRYAAKDAGCTIGGQTFRNFRLKVKTSVLSDQLKGEHPSPPLRADQILVTPVNYVKDGRRWIGFRFTTSKDAFEILGGPNLPKDYLDATVKGHDYRNCGFMTNYDIRFEVHGTAKWERGKVGYAGLATDRLVDGKWNEAANLGPGSRGNFGWYPRKIGQYGNYGGINPKTPSAGGWARLCSVSHAFGPGSKAPRANENWFQFVEETAPTSFEIRPVAWHDRDGELHTYGIWFRMNCWDKTHTRWRADYIEHSFTHAGVTDEIWTADGKNRAVQPADPRLKPVADDEPGEIPAPKFTGENLALEIADRVEMKFVRIPAGKFIMGSPVDEKGRCDDEGPRRVVTISKPFYMGVYEVTQEHWQAVMGTAAPGKVDDPQLPALTSHHARAVEFCRKLSAKTGRTIRLPSEAEWEYACRAGTRTPFHFGPDEKTLGDYAWFYDNSGKAAHPVGQKKPNAWGLYDMYGNALEWTGDWYADSLAGAVEVEPRGPESGEYHVVRGGSWSWLAEGCRSAARVLGSHSDLMDSKIVGFRVVCEIEDRQ